MASRGGRRPRGGGYRTRRQDAPAEAEVLDSETVECADKTIVLDMKSNTQGKFVKLTETKAGVPNVRGHIILSQETCPKLRTKLNEFVAEYEHLEPSSGQVEESITLKTDSFKGHMSRRLYYVDLRENQRGRFLKISLLTDDKKFIAVPGEVLEEFRDKFVQLLDKHPSSHVTKSIAVDGKTFYFDVESNERGTFAKVSEVLSNGYRPGHINVPQSVWGQVAEVFTTLGQELPPEESSGSDES